MKPTITNIKSLKQGGEIIDPVGNRWVIEAIIGNIVFLTFLNPETQAHHFHINHIGNFANENWVTEWDIKQRQKNRDGQTDLEQVLADYPEERILEILKQRKGAK